LYWNARFQWEQRSEESLLKAISLYEAALRRDRRFALAYAGLADALALMGVAGMRAPPSVFPRARESAQAAVRLDAHLAEAHASLGHVAVQYDRKWRQGLEMYQRALSLKPNFAQCFMWLANCHLMVGQRQAALEEARTAQRLEPMSLAFAANVGMVLSFEGKYDAAYAQLAGLVEAAPGAPLPRHHLARLYVFRGDPQKAVQLLEGFDKPAPGSFSDLGRAYALVGRRDDAMAQVERLDVLGRQDFGVGYDMALILLALGERDRALAALERALDDRSQLVGFVRSDPGFVPVREDSRFSAVVERLALN
jgi:serine/threonine-protein kinase